MPCTHALRASCADPRTAVMHPSPASRAAAPPVTQPGRQLTPGPCTLLRCPSRPPATETSSGCAQWPSRLQALRMPTTLSARTCMSCCTAPNLPQYSPVLSTNMSFCRGQRMVARRCRARASWHSHAHAAAVLHTTMQRSRCSFWCPTHHVEEGLLGCEVQRHQAEACQLAHLRRGGEGGAVDVDAVKRQVDARRAAAALGRVWESCVPVRCAW